MSAPFIRSAGGKRELAPTILSLMPDAESFDTYVEPFAGGAAVFYALRNDGRLDDKTVILGDGDQDLVALYAAVRDDLAALLHDAGRLVAAANKSADPKAFYESQRASWNGGHRTPARHLFLRKACWNGLWRTNKEGGMNTPWKGEPPKDLDIQQLMRASASLQGVEFLDWDFRKYEADDDFFVGERTLVYLDPPYLAAADEDGFAGYLPGGWVEQDLKDVFELCRSWTARGAHVVLSHAETPLARALSLDWKGASVHQIEARRSINSDGDKRGPVSEVIVVGHPAAVDTRHVTLHSISHGEDARPEPSLS